MYTAYTKKEAGKEQLPNRGYAPTRLSSGIPN